MQRFARYHLNTVWILINWSFFFLFVFSVRLLGLVVKASASRAEDPGFESRLWRDFSGASHKLKSWQSSGYPARRLALQDQRWRYSISAGTDRPGVSILWLGEVESLICSFYPSVAARKIVWADPSLRYPSMLLGRKATNKQQPLRETSGFDVSGQDEMNFFRLSLGTS